MVVYCSNCNKISFSHSLTEFKKSVNIMNLQNNYKILIMNLVSRYFKNIFTEMPIIESFKTAFEINYLNFYTPLSIKISLFQTFGLDILVNMQTKTY